MATPGYSLATYKLSLPLTLLNITISHRIDNTATWIYQQYITGYTPAVTVSATMVKLNEAKLNIFTIPLQDKISWKQSTKSASTETCNINFHVVHHQSGYVSLVAWRVAIYTNKKNNDSVADIKPAKHHTNNRPTDLLCRWWWHSWVSKSPFPFDTQDELTRTIACWTYSTENRMQSV